MKPLGQLATLTIVACLFWQMPAYAAENTYLYFVHGWPGRDLATNADPGFPVDVLLNDESCYLRGFTFGNSNGPLSLPPGQYDIKISPANTMAPCTNTPLIESTVALESNQDVTAVLALDDSGVPLLSTFPNHLACSSRGSETRYRLRWRGSGDQFCYKSHRLEQDLELPRQVRYQPGNHAASGRLYHRRKCWRGYLSQRNRRIAAAFRHRALCSWQYRESVLDHG